MCAAPTQRSAGFVVECPELTQRHTKLVQRMRLGLDGKDPEKIPKLVVKLEVQHILKLLPCFKGAFLHVDDVSESSLHLTKKSFFLLVVRGRCNIYGELFLL